jgi:hypothetical protein
MSIIAAHAAVGNKVMLQNDFSLTTDSYQVINL